MSTRRFLALLLIVAFAAILFHGAFRQRVRVLPANPFAEASELGGALLIRKSVRRGILRDEKTGDLVESEAPETECPT